MTRPVLFLTVFALMSTALAGGANAADLFSSGARTWDTTSANWGTNAGGPHAGATWSSATPDSAIFEGAADTVTLGENITVSNVLFTAANYTIADNTLSFVVGGSITNSVVNQDQTITAGITGSPSVGIADGSTGNRGLVFAPTSATQTLGVCTVPYNDDVAGGDKCRLTLGGTTTGNSVSKIRKEHNYANVYKTGSGMWTLGDVDVGAIYLAAGSLAVNGTFNKYYSGFVFTGGKLMGTGTINTAVTVPFGGTLAPGVGVGTLSINGNVNLGLESTTEIEVDGGGVVCDTLAVTGTVTIAGDLDVAGLDAVTIGNELTIIDNDGVDPVSGTFAHLSPADLVVNYAGGDGNDVTVTRSATAVNPVSLFWDGNKTAIDGASDGGAGDWDLSAQNWDDGSTRMAWTNSPLGNRAVFQTADGAVDLLSDISLGAMLIEGDDNYIIGDDTETHSLNFAGSGSILVNQVRATIRAGISGSPSLRVYGNNGDPLYLYPGGTNMTLGDVTVGGIPNNPELELGGTTTGNAINRVLSANNWSFLNKVHAGTWRLGDVNIGTLRLYDGTLVVNGIFNKTYQGLQFSGGRLEGTGVFNAPVVVQAAGTLAPGDPIGTMTVTNNDCTISGTLAVSINGAQSCMLAVDQTLTISDATLDFNVIGTATESSYVLATYGTLVGTFAATNNVAAGMEIDYAAHGGTAITISAETNAPTPNPMAFSVAPAGISPSKIAMTATNASDVSGPVSYYFENVTNANTSGWISGVSWTNGGLLTSTTYGYRVKARDAFGNETAWSAVAEATTLAADTDAPTPDPMNFAVAPAAESATDVVMTAATASDPSTPVQYYFENTSNSNNSGWQAGTVWTNSGLTPETSYGYRVKARDAVSNETAWSSVFEETTPENTPPTPDPMAFAVPPASLDATRIVMTATNASDVSGPVAYYFENTTNSADSGWIANTVWTNTGLTLGMSYGYRVKARDALGNETGWSPVATASPAPETTPPEPNPMSFVQAPEPLDDTSMIMTATTAIDALTPPVQYYFENTVNSNTSGWVSGTVWTNGGLVAEMTYGYQVKARDALSNETVWSAIEMVLLPRPGITVYWDGAASGGNGNGTSDGGSGLWSAAVTNWDQGSGQPREVWYNGDDDAILGGSVGTVTLGEDIALKSIRFTAAGNDYTVSGKSLNFGVDGSIIQSVKNIKHTITCAIAGSPDVGVINGTGYEGLTFAPTNGSVALGTLTVPYDNPVGGDKAGLHLAGTTTGNSVGKVRFDGGDRYGAIYKDGSGTWALGDVDIGIVYLNAGDLVVNGTMRTWYAGLQLKGGTFHYNNAGAVTAHQGLNFNGGVGAVSMDNSSGAAITNSIYNPPQNWGVDWTFMGVNGADSDLDIGAGAVTLGGDRTVSVSNALTTLTIGGVIGDGTAVRGLTKAGAGTLKLAGANTYEGSTTVNDGTLHITQPFLADGGILSVTNGAMLHLDFSGTDTVLAVVFDGMIADVGTWGAPGSGADHTTNLLSGTGLLKHNGGQVADGLWFWDGPNTNGSGNGFCDGGSGIWSASVTNWDHGLVTRKAWSGTTNDFVFFQTLAGTVDLQSDVTLGGVLIDGVDNYVIGSTPETQTMHFGGMNSITVKLVKATFRAGITGSPDMHLHGDSGDQLYMYPDSADMVLGNVTVGGGAGAGNNPVFYLGGSTTGNTIAKVINGNDWSRIFKQGTGTWTLGDVAIGGLNIQAGRLVVNGTYNPSYPSFHTFTGGTLAGTGTINHVLTVPAGGAIAPGDPTGTLTITNNNCTIAGSLAIEVDALKAPGWGTLAVEGDLDIAGATLDLTVGVMPPEQNLVIATFDSLTGTFESVNGLPPNWKVDYGFNGGTAIALNNPGLALMIILK